MAGEMAGMTCCLDLGCMLGGLTAAAGGAKLTTACSSSGRSRT